MKLLTATLRKKFATVGDTSNKRAAETMVVAKFFNPVGAGTWYAAEFDGEDTFFGFVDLGFGPACSELGSFSLSELESLKLPLGLGIERDLHYGPETLAEVMARHSA